MIPDSYWAHPEKLLAGPLPVATEREALRAQVRWLIDSGVRTVIDLRTPAEPPAIRSLFEKLARDDEDVAWVGAPILDGGAPTRGLMSTILDVIDGQHARGRGVYVHCAGGRGRTGTVIACWWIRHGHCADGEAALGRIKELRAGLPGGAHASPETPVQFRLVRAWSRGL